MPLETLRTAVQAYDRAKSAPALEAAARERAEILERFPPAAWKTLALEQYALGHANSEKAYCRLLEFGSQHCGSMRGNTARKFLVYAKQDGSGFWFRPGLGATVTEAWEQVRAGFVALLDSAAAGSWDDLDDEVPTLRNAPMAKLKTLHIYFPDQIIPIYSQAHLLHYLRLVGRPEGDDPRRWDVVRLNRILLDGVRALLPVDGWSTLELARFLYKIADPRKEPRVVKIAPGEQAAFWEDCRGGGYICVGWDEIGDLSAFDDFDPFLDAFKTRWGKRYGSSTKTKAKEVWILQELEPGDRVIANRGIGKVLGVGTVKDPGYFFNEQRAQYKHCVAVDWDESYAQDIPAQPRWGLVTIADVPDKLWAAIQDRVHPVDTGKAEHVAEQVDEGPVPTAPDLATLEQIAKAMERKKQVILFGPPGTGKTYTARRFALRWLLEHEGREKVARTLADREKGKAAERTLSSSSSGAAPLTWLTFHPSYSYEDFVEGYRPKPTESDGLVLALRDGIFKRVCAAAAASPGRRFLIVIDEINRANLAKVFGELITLLEADKRGLEIVLPQSGQRFQIPENVFVLGTMNTADRSIKLFDLALRRRFAFVEAMPDLGPLAGAAVGPLALDAFLGELNRRIAGREGREKQIGQAVLLDGKGRPVAGTEEFAARFAHEVLPLLQEYCYEDWSALQGYLGTRLVDAENHALADDILDRPDLLMEVLAAEFANPDEEL